MKTLAAIQSFLNSRRALKRSLITIQWYECHLGKFASFCPELPMEPEPIEEFLSTITGEPETVHAYYRSIKALYHFFCRRNRLLNPMDLIDPPSCPNKVMPTMEADEHMRLLNSAGVLRDQAILHLFVDSGVRSSELAGLRKQDIKTETVIVYGKCGQREVPISAETKRLLLTLVANNGNDEYVFHGQRGPLSRHGVYRVVCAHMKKAGISGPKLGGHRIRHAFGKGYLVNGGDLRSLQQIMGHKSITTTQKYASLNLKDVIEKHHKFTPLRTAHAAAQDSFLDKDLAIREAEEILQRNSQ